MAEKKSYKIKNIDYTTKEKHRRPEKSQWEENFQKAKKKRIKKKNSSKKSYEKNIRLKFGCFWVENNKKGMKEEEQKNWNKIFISISFRCV